jgi:hypothetical protein
MFLTNLSFNRHESSRMLLSNSVHSNRVSILGVGTSSREGGFVKQEKQQAARIEVEDATWREPSS